MLATLMLGRLVEIETDKGIVKGTIVDVYAGIMTQFQMQGRQMLPVQMSTIFYTILQPGGKLMATVAHATNLRVLAEH